MGNELLLRAQSLAAAPRSRELRDALLAESRRRFQTAATETVAAYAYLLDNCFRAATLPDTLIDECRRLTEPSSDFPEHAIGLVSDATAQIAVLAEAEVLNAAATGEGIAPALAESREAYANSLWGADSARLRAAEAAMGDAETVAYGIAGPGAENLDAAFAATVEPDARAQLALELMVAFEVPLGVLIEDADGNHRFLDPALVDGGAGAPPEERRFVDSRFNLLDHRIAALYQAGPYSLAELADTYFDVENSSPPLPGDAVRAHDALTLTEFEVIAGNPIASPYRSPLRTVFGIQEADVDQAVTLAGNILQTMDVTYDLRRQVIFPDGRALGAVRFKLIEQRPIERFAAALQNLSPADAAHDEYTLGGIAPDPLIFTPSTEFLGRNGRIGNHYALDGAQAARMGGALTVHNVLIHLRRLAASARAAVFGVDVEALRPVIEMAEGYVGTRFFQSSRFRDATCLCDAGGGELAECPSGTADPTDEGSPTTGYLDCSRYHIGDSVYGPRRDPLIVDGEPAAFWTAYFSPDDAPLADPSGRAAIVRTREDAFCLRHGQRPDGRDSECLADPTVLLSFDFLDEAFGAGAFAAGDGRPEIDILGLEARRFVIPRAETYEEPSATDTSGATAYVFWVRAVDGVPTYELLDVVQPRRDGAVHVFGGRFGELFAEVTAKQPLNPGRPVLTSLGLPADLVPPLESELTSDGDRFEDSYRTYLDNAAASASNARALMQEARDFEFRTVLEDRREAGLLEEAALAEQEVVSAACGEPGGCDIERVESIALGEILIDGEPFVTLPDVSEIEFAATTLSLHAH